jgi:predicted dehydrogenase
MKDKIRIGIIGCANIAFRSMIPAIKQVEKLQLIAIASRNIAKAEQFSKIFDVEPVEGYENLLRRSDIDAVYIPLPTGLHEEWIIKALNFNKHVLAEKSLALDINSAVKMLQQAEGKKLVLMEDFMYRYHSQHQFIFDHIKNGTIGEMRNFKSNFGFPPFAKNNFRYKKKMGGGAILDAAAYTVNVSCMFLGNNLELGSANLIYNRKNKVCIHGTAMLHSPVSNLTSHIAFGFDNFYQCNYEIWGSKGSIYCDRSFTPPPDYRPKVCINKPNEMYTFSLPPDDHFINILKEFVICIQNNHYNKHIEELYNQSRLLSEIESKGVIHYK